jgi:HAMP domain-containing protein/HPt (histidine-containing phosphotransfer) domain-containing protein
MKATLKRIAFSIVTRNILTFLVILSLVVATLAYRYLQDVEDLMSNTIKAQLDAVAELGRFMLKVEEVDEVRNIIWYDTPEYEAMLRTLATIQRNFGVDNAVLLRRLPNEQFVYVGDGNRQFAINEAVGLHQAFPETYPPANRAWTTGEPNKTALFQSGDSRWFQVYTPLMRGDRVVALLLLNRFATPIAVAIEQRQQQILMGVLVALTGGIFVWWFITSRSLRPLIRLQRASREIAAGNLDIEIPDDNSRSEIGELNRSFRTMVRDLRASQAAIEEHNRTLEQRIAERTRELQGLFDNMDEGLFTLDAAGAIEPRYSAAARQMLGEIGPDTNFIALLSDDEDTRKSVRDTFALLLGGTLMLDWDDMVANLPAEFQGAGERWLRARYRPVYDESGEKIERAMVILQDVTHEKALQADIERNRDEQTMVVSIIQNRETFDLFYDDALKLLGESAQALRGMELIRRSVIDQAFRTLHTIKGTAGLFGLRAVARRAHGVEDTLRDLNARRDETWRPEQRDALLAGLEQVRGDLVEAQRAFLALIGEEDSEATFTLSEKRLDAIVADALAAVPPAAAGRLRTVLERLKRIPAGRLLRKYKALVEAIAGRLGKQAQLVLREQDDTELPAEFFQQLDPTFLHIIRNAVDHGIEDVEGRMEAGKEPLATITCTTARRNGGILFSIADDGRGIDLRRIRDIGLERGFIKPDRAASLSREDILRLLFLPAFSSKDAVTELSGRGVGLDVVRTDVERMHGRIRLVTRRGRGTTFQLYYPLPG